MGRLCSNAEVIALFLVTNKMISGNKDTVVKVVIVRL